MAEPWAQPKVPGSTIGKVGNALTNSRDPSLSTEFAPRVAEAERLGQGVFITFNTGEFGFYSAILLYEMLSHAEMRNDDFPG